MATIETGTNTPLYLFYLVDAAGFSYYVDGGGEVKKRGQPTPLGYSPDGWQNLAIGWERNLQKFGLVRNFSLSLGFVGDGAQIISHILFSENEDARLWLLVQRRDVYVEPYNPVDNGLWDIVHRFFYKGEIDLSTYDGGRRRVKVNIMEGGRSADIKANESTPFEIPLDVDPETIRVKMHGIKLAQTGNFIGATDLTISNNDWYQFAFPIGLAGVDGRSTGVSFFSQEIQAVPGTPAAYASSAQNYFVEAEPINEAAVVFTVEGKIIFFVEENSIATGGTFTPLMYKDTGAASGVSFSGSASGQPKHLQGQTYEWDLSGTLTLQPGEKSFLLATIGSVSTPSAVEIRIRILEGTFLKLSYKNAYRPTFIKAFKPLDLFRRITEKLSGSRDYASSSLLQSSSLCVTSGDGLRGLTGSAIKTTFQQFYQAFSVVKCAGIGVEGEKIVLESREHFLRRDYVVDLGEVKDMQITPALDVIYNVVKVGYPDQSYDDVNGRAEFNSEQVYSSPRRRAPKPLELVSTYRADPYGIEFTRVNMDGKATTDSSSDNDCFILNVDLDNPQTDAAGIYYNLKRATYSSLTGVPDPVGIFNIEELTPKRILNAWKSYLKGIFFNYSGALTFQTAKKNKELATTGGPGGNFAESADLPLADLGDPLFQPKKLTFKAVQPLNLSEILELSPYACFKGTYRSIPFQGFLLKGAMEPKSRQEQSFALLADPFTDLKPFEYE